MGKEKMVEATSGKWSINTCFLMGSNESVGQMGPECILIMGAPLSNNPTIQSMRLDILSTGLYNFTRFTLLTGTRVISELTIIVNVNQGTAFFSCTGIMIVSDLTIQSHKS